MTPIISYKNFIKNATDKTLARNQIKERILASQMSISAVARRLNCSRFTVRKLLKENDLNYEKRKAPHNCPHKLSSSIEDAIIEYHKKTGYGPDMIKLNGDFNHSTSTIYRVLKDHNLVNIRKRRYKKKRYVNRIKKRLKAFEKWQLDTKYLTDIPNIIGPIHRGIIPKYEYTLRDMKTGTTFIGYGLRERSVKDSCSFIALSLYHIQLHGIDTHYVNIQSDNGSEFLGHIDKKDPYEIQKTIEKFGARFNTIPIRRPTFNSHVESFHGRIEYEVYDRISIRKLNTFSKKMSRFMFEWNTKRKSLKARKTPEKIARDSGYLLKKCFYKFPILFYDTITKNERNPIFLPGHYLPDEVNRLLIPYL
jgi:AraC-like DNA-binding protein